MFKVTETINEPIAILVEDVPNLTKVFHVAKVSHKREKFAEPDVPEVSHEVLNVPEVSDNVPKLSDESNASEPSSISKEIVCSHLGKFNYSSSSLLH